MSCHHGSVARPGSARVRVTELNGPLHPTPATKPCEDSETDLNIYLSPGNLELLCGTQDLSQVTKLEICIDTRNNTLGNFGAYLPSLVQLKMNNSVIVSTRDLGTSLSQLQVLWMSHCSLQDLEGISALSSLRELYVAYNNLSELNQLGMLENLHLLDLEGNDVDDLVQVQYLGFCSKLQRVTLEGNPVCVLPHPAAAQVADYSYRSAVRKLVPQLRYLDDVKVEEEPQSCSSPLTEEMAILRNYIKTSSQAASEDGGSYPSSRPSSARNSSSSFSPISSAGSRPSTDSRPTSGTLSPCGSRPSSEGLDIATAVADFSMLMHGAGKIRFCGNPIKAILAKKTDLRTPPASAAFNPCELPIYVPENTCDLEGSDGEASDNVHADLSAWRERHSRRLQAIERERSAQLLVIQNGEEEGKDEEEEEEEEEGSGDVRDDSGDEEDTRGQTDIAPPDTSRLSFSPDPPGREPTLAEVVRPSLSPEAKLSPSPPTSAAAPGSRRPVGIRARRIQLKLAAAEPLPHSSSEELHPRPASLTAHTDLRLKTMQQDAGTSVLKLPPIPHPPSAGALGGGRVVSRTEKDIPRAQGDSKCRQSKLLDGPLIPRPHAVRPALRKHSQQPIIQSCRGSSHPD